ncbi:hypothetical protein [Candidatus Nitrospira bockiana]
MDWALVTWGVLIGMVGMLWVVAMAVIQDAEKDHESADETEDGTGAQAENPERCQQRSAA